MKWQSTDGEEARLPLRWPKQETGKTALFSIPSSPADTRTATYKLPETVKVPNLKIETTFVWLFTLGQF